MNAKSLFVQSKYFCIRVSFSEKFSEIICKIRQFKGFSISMKLISISNEVQSPIIYTKLKRKTPFTKSNKWLSNTLVYSPREIKSASKLLLRYVKRKSKKKRRFLMIIRPLNYFSKKKKLTKNLLSLGLRLFFTIMYFYDTHLHFFELRIFLKTFL